MELNTANVKTEEQALAFAAKRVNSYSVVQVCYDDRPRFAWGPWVVFYG